MQNERPLQNYRFPCFFILATLLNVFGPVWVVLFLCVLCFPAMPCFFLQIALAEDRSPPVVILASLSDCLMSCICTSLGCSEVDVEGVAGDTGKVMEGRETIVSMLVPLSKGYSTRCQHLGQIAGCRTASLLTRSSLPESVTPGTAIPAVHRTTGTHPARWYNRCE